MKRRLLMGLCCGLALTACGSPTPTPDLVATQVAVERAAAATLTAEAPPLPTPASAPTNTFAPPTSTPEQPTPTGAPPPPTPIPPTPTPPIYANVPVDGGLGDLLGEVILPGVAPPAPDPLVFTSQIVFRVLVRDPQVGNQDGAGIDSVDFTILQVNPDGSEVAVHARTERVSGYCAFGGGEPDCMVWVFAEHGNTWPDGSAVVSGPHRAEMSLHPRNPNRQGANWRFTFDIALP